MTNRNNNKYFHPREFIGNNIEFRIGSSAALAKFKETQSFILNQLALNPFHNFSNTAKEMLLFKYDVGFDLMCELEQYLLVTDSTEYCSGDILPMINERLEYINETLLKRGDIIDLDYYKLWMQDYQNIVKSAVIKLNEVLRTSLNPASIFGALIDLYIQVMNHSLFTLQEFDVVFFSEKTPIFNLDMYGCCVGGEKESPMYKKIKLLQTVRPFNEIIIKNYLEGLVFKNTDLYQNLKDNDIKYTII